MSRIGVCTNILVICAGNQCRSPYAAAVIAKFLPQVNISSSGFDAVPGRRAHELTQRIATENGLDLSEFRSRRFNVSDAIKSDIVLCMERAQKRWILENFPILAGRVYLLTHWQERQDVFDPVASGEADHRKVYGIILDAVLEWANVIKESGTL